MKRALLTVTQTEAPGAWFGPVLLGAALASPGLAQWSSLPPPATFGAATVVSGRAAFSSGTEVHLFDPATQTWQVTALPQVNGAVAAASAGGSALFTDGFLVDIYSPSGAGWSTTSLSQPHAQVAATSVGVQVLFAGGDPSMPGADLVEIYDVSTGAWSSGNLSVGRVGVSATSAQGRAFFAGGDTGGPGGFGSVTDRVDIYDATTGSWSIASLSVARWGCTAAAIGSKVLFAGGDDVHGRTSVVDIYDIATGVWSIANLSAARAASTAVTIGTKVLFVGGDGSSVVDVYDDATGTWSATTLTSGFGCGIGADPAAVVGSLALFASRCSGALLTYDDAIGMRYCSPAASNSTGAPARIGAQGYPGSVAQGYVLLTAEQLPPQSLGYFLNSTSQGFSANPAGSQGDLCLGGAIGRYAASPFQTGAAGLAELRLDLADTPTPSGAVAIAAGQTWNFQAWYRDANPGPTSNFTDAVSVTFQ